MPSIFDNARRWVNDRLAKPDELIEGTPQQKIRETYETLQGLTPAERTRAVEHVQAYATYYHQGRHNEFVPADTAREIFEMQRYSERLTRVDAARGILERYGGAPSQRTLAEALDRSHKEREGIKEKPAKRERQEVREKQTVREGPRVRIS
jgi:hypothetical protein